MTPPEPSETPRRFAGGPLVIASHNAGKVREIGELLAGHGAAVVSAGALGLPEPAETAGSFVGNARQKAAAAADGSGHPALADDSGLVVAALGGEPGVDTALWAEPPGGGPRDFGLAMQRLHDRLAAVGARAPGGTRAHFVCALVLAWPDGHAEAVEGTVHGHVVWPPRGDRGFGFDPVFVPDGHALTFAEMDPAAKHAISHRADAFARLVARCFPA
jgi:XTP/dITP diphosphohydrolase